MINFKKLWLCKIIQSHDWTCKAGEGIKPTEEELSTADSFWSYAKLYCKECGHVSKLSIKK